MPRSQASFSIYEDPSALSPPSPPYTPSCSSSNAAPHLHSIEQDDPHTTSDDTPRRASATTAISAISSLPSEPCSQHSSHSPYAPMRHRQPFRNPSSVRALQMSSPQPFEAYSSPFPRSAKRYATPSRSTVSRSGSVLRSGGDGGGSRRGSARPHHRHAAAQVADEDEQERTRCLDAGKNHPLGLLHATLLPVPCPWSAASMAAVLPAWVLENYRLLEGKMSETVLRRGVLIPHPRDEYELLEEKLLESLELRVPRILKCGHFCGGEESEGEEDGGWGMDVGGRDGENEEAGDLESDGVDVCGDCNRPIKYPGTGVGSGRRRWDIKIYAANGLMRAGAWSAAWSEMERIDVEISPWIPEDARRELDRMREEQETELRMLEMAQAEEEEQRRVEDALMAKKMRLEDMTPIRRDLAPSTVRPEKEMGPSQSADGVFDMGKMPASTSMDGTLSERPHMSDSNRNTQIPLGTLLRNYLYVVSKDRRNIAIFMLSTVVLWLCTSSRSSSVPATTLRPLQSSIADPALCSPAVSVSTITATVTEVMPTLSVASDPSTSAATAATTDTSVQSPAVPPPKEVAEVSSSAPLEAAPSQTAALNMLSLLDEEDSHLDFIEAT